jgi:tRNA modification GTPase
MVIIVIVNYKPFSLYSVTQIGVKRSEAAALTADVIIMAVSAIDGWSQEDAKLIEHIMMSQVF